ncbi:MAG: hypothetical protein P9M14_03490 [Candidatus Alcyoniella australis]|nr:hypothetical protein [Candidatus Alcyoniella australis]
MAKYSKKKIKLKSVRPPADFKTIIVLLASGSAVLVATLLVYFLGTPVINQHYGPDNTLIDVLQFLIAFFSVAAFFGVGALVLGLIKLFNRLRHMVTNRNEPSRTSRPRKKSKR